MYKYLLDTDIKLYDLLNNISFIFLLFFNLSQIKKKKELLSYPSQFAIHSISNSRLKNKFLCSYIPWAVIEIFLISIVQYAFVKQLTVFTGKLADTGNNYFGLLFFTPIFLMLFCLFLRINPLKQIDLITPAFALALIISKLGCFCAGCCHGIVWEYGLYNYKYERLEFPVQLLEAGLALLIFIFLLLWRKKAKDGTLFPTYLILYCATRFFSEFTRGEENVFGILKVYHILCIVGLVAGIIELILILRYGKYINAFFDKHQFIPPKKKKSYKKWEKRTIVHDHKKGSRK